MVESIFVKELKEVSPGVYETEVFNLGLSYLRHNDDVIFRDKKGVKFGRFALVGEVISQRQIYVIHEKMILTMNKVRLRRTDKK